jgi:hypothetical protein
VGIPPGSDMPKVNGLSRTENLLWFHDDLE